MNDLHTPFRISAGLGHQYVKAPPVVMDTSPAVVKASSVFMNEALEESSRDRILIERLPLLVWTAGLDGSVTYCNTAWHSYTLLTAEQILGDGWLRAVPPHLRERVARVSRHAAKRNRAWRIRLALGRARDGVFRCHILRAVPIRNVAGDLTGWIGTAIDVHDEILAERALRECQARLQVVTKMVPDLLWTTDHLGKADWFNQRWSDHTGLASDHSLKWGWLDAVHPQDRERSRQNIQRAISTGRALVQEQRICGRDGNYSRFLMRLEPLRSEGADIVRWFGAATNIDGQREDLETLRNTEDHRRAFVELNPQFPWMSDAEGRTTVMEAFDNERSNAPEVTPSKPWTSIALEADLARALQAWQQAIATGERLDTEARLLCKSDVYRWYRIQAAPRRNARGAIVQWYGTFDDIHERLEELQSLHESEERYRVLFEALDEGLCIIQSCEAAGSPVLDYRFIAANGAFARQTGLENVVGKSLASVFLGRPPPWCDLCLDVLQTGRSLRFEYEVPNQRRLLELFAFRLDHPARARVAVILRDITSRRDADTALKRSEERFRQFAENTGNVMWIADPHSRAVEYRSPAYDHVWGEPASSAPATLDHMFSTVHPEDIPQVEGSIQRVTAGEPVRFEYRIIRVNDGAIRWLRNTSFPIRGEDEKVVKIAGVVEDLTRYEGIQVYLAGAADDEAQRLAKVLRNNGRRVKIFGSLADFLAVAAVLTPGCVIVDMRRSSREAPSVLREIKARSSGLPLIIIGKPDVDTRGAVAAMKSGAVDFLQPPLDDDLLNAAIVEAAADLQTAAEPTRTSDHDAAARLARLSTREREVLTGLLDGGTNKTIAAILGISPRTIELHRARLMERLNVDTLAELLQVAIAAGHRGNAAKAVEAFNGRRP